MEIIVAHRQGIFEQVTFTQKRDFQAYNPKLRPGALLTLQKNSAVCNILFLHTDSGTAAPDFGNRQEMFEKIDSLKKAIDKKTPGGAGSLIVLGDLNTMGLWYPTRRKKDQRVTAPEEIAALEGLGKKLGMWLVRKEFDETFNNGTLISALDHVLASGNLTFTKQGTSPDGKDFFVRVSGWQQLAGMARQQFIDEISDHCSLSVTVH